MSKACLSSLDFVSILLKNYLFKVFKLFFKLFSVVVTWNIKYPSTWTSHPTFTTSRNRVFWAHALQWANDLLLIYFLLAIVNFAGQWSLMPSGINVASHKGMESNQTSLIKIQSIFESTLWSLPLSFHVYLLPWWGWMSKSQVSTQFWKYAILDQPTWLPHIRSSRWRTELKSPRTSHGLEQPELILTKLFQRSLLSSLVLKAYTTERRNSSWRGV